MIFIMFRIDFGILRAIVMIIMDNVIIYWWGKGLMALNKQKDSQKASGTTIHSVYE